MKEGTEVEMLDCAFHARRQIGKDEEEVAERKSEEEETSSVCEDSSSLLLFSVPLLHMSVPN